MASVRSTTWLRGFAAVVVALSLGGCRGCRPEPKPEGCTSAGDCGGKECVNGTCQTCDRGTNGCVCRDNNTCDPGLACSAGSCSPCTVGTEGCACRSDMSCDSTLTCSAGTCVPDNCMAGRLGCPCGTGNTCDTGLTCNGNVCANCSADVVGCPCSNGSCTGGLVCNTATTTCRDPITCANAGCVPQQVCMAASAGTDAQCLEQCNPGFTWNDGTGMCDPVATANCDSGAPGSILDQCNTLNRGCTETATGAMCAGCQSGFTEDNGAPACRAVRTCATAGCTATHRVCTPEGPNTDAVCAGCEQGYVQVGTVCVQILPGTCEADGGNGLFAACALNGRQCVAGDGGAACGDCLPGLMQSPTDPDVCDPPPTCMSLGCAALNRECSDPADGGAPSACGNCLLPLVPQDVNNPQSPCVPRPSCATTNCNPDGGAGNVFCVEDPQNGPQCVTPPCNALQALRLDTNTCVTCGSCGTVPGETGRHWPFTQTGTGLCICETEPGYYFSPGSSSAEPCDRDGDGWVTESARGPSEAPNDPGLRQNARCNVRRIDRFRLINEYGQTMDIRTCTSGQAVPVGQTTPPCIPADIPLYETDQNDDETQLIDDKKIYRYGPPSMTDGGAGRRPIAAELNPLTKYCTHVLGDYNDNEVSDISEYPGQPGQMGVGFFSQFSYYAELHDGYYEAVGTGGAYGRYVIKERSRCDADFPLGYITVVSDGGALLSDGDYWRNCARRRDADFNSMSATNHPINMDFGQWTCSDTQGSCAIEPPPVPVPTVGPDIPPHGLCEIPLPPPASTGGWRGMSHHSQFKCVVLRTALTPAPVGDEVHYIRRVGLDIHTSPGDTNVEQFNRCKIDCPNDNCAADCTDGRCTTSSLQVIASMDGGVTRTPRLSCEPVYDGANEEVGFVAERFPDLFTTGYKRGCINEWEEASWRSLCPGYVADGGAVGLGEGETPNFGALLCGCESHYGGPGCTSPCTDADLLLSPGYTARRNGYWMCANVSLSNNPVLRQYPDAGAPGSGDGGYVMRSEVPFMASPVQPLCATPACDTGYVLR